MTDWRDGGNKPMQYARKCAVCGESIELGTRDYFYAKNPDTGAYEHAHRKCVPAEAPPGAIDASGIIDAIREHTEVLKEVAAGIHTLVAQGAK